MIIIIDTSPLSSLAIVGYLSILKDIYARVIIPQAVANELANSTEEDIRLMMKFLLDQDVYAQTARCLISASDRKKPYCNYYHCF